MTTSEEEAVEAIAKRYGSRERWLECLLQEGREAPGLACGELCVEAHTEILRLDAELTALKSLGYAKRSDVTEEWRPIESAPDELVLIYVPDAPSSGASRLVGYRDAFGAWWPCAGVYPVKPSHWQPLPAPPTLRSRPQSGEPRANLKGSVVISSGGVSPSNRNAGFPNLARLAPFADDVVEHVTATCKAELEAAGIEAVVFSFVINAGEVPSKAVGQLSMWGFHRAWYYWVAEGPGLPVEIAEKLHATHGRVVRVAGHCGCPSPREWFKGFGVGSYHVDSPEGLAALASALRSVEARDAVAVAAT